MKKATTIFGLLSAICIVAGVIQKIFHLPGAMYMLMFGICVFLMVYMVLLCIQKVRESRGLGRAMYIVKYVSYMYLALGFLFLINHFPGAMYIMDAGFVIFILGYLPLKFLVQRAKHPEGGALNKVIPSLIIIILIFTLASRNLGERIFESIAYSDMQVNTMSSAIDTSLNSLMSEFESNKDQFPAQVFPKFVKAIKIKKLGDEMSDYINKCKIEVITVTNNGNYYNYFRIDEINGKANSNKPNQYFMDLEKEGGNEKAFEIKEKLKLFNDSINIVMETDSANKIMLPIMMDGFTWKSTGETISWEVAIFHDNMLINDLAYLDILLLSIKQTEMELIASLLSEARSDAMWTFWKKYKELSPDKNGK